MTAYGLALPALLFSAAPGTGALAAEPGEGVAMNVLAAVMMLAGIVLLGFILVRQVQIRIARRQAATPSPRERIDRIVEGASARDDIHGVGADMLDTAQRLATQLDNKAARLEQLIVEADARLALLERHAGAPPTPEVDELEPEPPAASRPRPEPVPTPLPVPAASGPAADPLTAAVYDLADRGRDTLQIARELDEQIGKVELILALRGER